MAEQQTNPAAAALAEIDASGGLDDGGVSRLVLAVEAVLKLHRRSMFPASMGEHRGRHYCPACTAEIDHQTDYADWPCFEYLAILAALTGTTVVAITARELAEHKAGCPECQRGFDWARCERGFELAARWRRALREAGTQL
jgi:hypothetical protein